tara:strand:+ start:696 stop:815 length:120 start_codon:yes stop_codon:yes gene_type:complete
MKDSERMALIIEGHRLLDIIEAGIISWGKQLKARSNETI